MLWALPTVWERIMTLRQLAGALIAGCLSMSAPAFASNAILPSAQGIPAPEFTQRAADERPLHN
jgi:hypothetical protein